MFSRTTKHHQTLPHVIKTCHYSTGGRMRRDLQGPIGQYDSSIDYNLPFSNEHLEAITANLEQQLRRQMSTKTKELQLLHRQALKNKAKENPDLDIEVPSKEEVRQIEVGSAGVMIPLLNVNNRMSILYTLRSSLVGTHKGQVSFPGGKMDPEDNNDAVVTALRETHEEIGIEREDVQILGLTHDFAAVTGIRVTPVVGFLGSFPSDEYVRNELTKWSEHEIEDVFTVPIADLVDPEHLKIETHEDHTGIFGTKFTMPEFTSTGHRIWGLTAIMTDAFIREVIEEVVGKAGRK
eukprot:TRINITY_DN22592_c0_g1_i1.p1 TRINITY_DN22592_c0_g1~~TRINITY_DN22592_c0_g1_i1.p1  ORF type:complete len:293 (-),score=79.99 TRINITY_DN22592_c0_g1_i1:21-899(-)